MKRTQDDVRQQLLVFWIGTSFPVLYGIAWAGIAGFFPPPAPDLTAAEVLRFYQQHSLGIRAGMALCMVVNCLCVPWAVAIWSQMRRLERDYDGLPVWSMFQISIGLLNVAFFMTPTLLWEAAAFAAQFRPDFSAQNIQVLNDCAWLLWFGTWAPTTFQCWTLAHVGLRDKRPVPLFPRTWCYIQFWVGLAFAPAGFIEFFIKGPLSWVGLVGLFVPVLVYFFWFPLTAWGLYRAIRMDDDAVPVESGAALKLQVAV